MKIELPNIEQPKSEQSSVQRVYDSLLSDIRSGSYGTHLPPQEQLAVAHGVSRTVLREALSRLRQLNVLDVRPKLGTRIKPISEWKTVVPLNQEASNAEICAVLQMFMNIYSIQGWEGDPAYIRAQALLAQLSTSV